jgi:hypothetical protein
MADQTEKVQIIVEADDRATRTLNNVAREMGDVAKQSKGLGSAFAGFGGAMSTAVGVFTGGLALDAAVAGVSALTGVVTDGIAGAKEAALGFAQLEAVLASTGGTVGFTADELAGLASDLSQAAGVSTFADDQVLALENMLLTFTNIRGEIFKEATQIGLDMATAIGAEPKDMAVQLGKALNDPVKGMTALSRVGVTFTKEQKAQVKAMVETNDIAGAQAVILAELETEFGGSAKAAAEALGPQAQFAEIMGELGEEIGTAVLPMINELFAILVSPSVQSALSAIVAGFTAFLRLNFDAVKTFFQALTGNWTDAPDKILPIHRLFGNLGLLIRDTVVPAFESFVKWIQSLATAFQAGGIEGFVTALLDGLAGADVAIVETVASWYAAFLDWIGPMIPPLLVKLGEVLTAILKWIGDKVPDIAAKLLEWGIAFSQWIGERIPIIMVELGKLLDGILNWMRDNKTEINAKLKEWADLFGKWVMEEAWPYMLTELSRMLSLFIAWIIANAPNLAREAIAWGTSMITGILDGITGGWWRVAAKVAQLMAETLSGGAFRQFFGGGGGGGGAVPVAAAGLNTLGAPSTTAFSAIGGGGRLRLRAPAAPVSIAIAVDARGADDPYAVEQAAERGVRSALSQASRRSVGNFRLALDQLGMQGE